MKPDMEELEKKFSDILNQLNSIEKCIAILDARLSILEKKNSIDRRIILEVDV